MGPLFPEMIGFELNLVIALIIGVLFGIILEQAGFSSSKKLVGLFYGYDFTVLRVFFTAGIVAMGGVILFDYHGLIDINLIYVNPTFVWSGIIGGLIMGLGFVVGGFCPGTAVCASAIGKVDAMLFIFGSALGIIIFMEGYPLFEGIYKADFLGYVRVFDSLGMPQNIFAFLLTAVALFAFWAVSIIENKVNGVKKKSIRFTPYYMSLAGIGALLLFSSFAHPERKEFITEKANNTSFVDQYKVKVLSYDEMAFRIIDRDDRYQVIDFRTAEEQKKFRLPGTLALTVDNLFEKETAKILNKRKTRFVFVANDELSERRIAVMAMELGFKNISILEGGLNGFKQIILGFKTPEVVPTTVHKADQIRFRTKAARILPDMIKESMEKGVVKVKKSKRVLGGC